MSTDKIIKVNTDTKWKCSQCNWIGEHKDSADKTPVVNNMWLLVCPKCGSKEFEKP